MEKYSKTRRSGSKGWRKMRNIQLKPGEAGGDRRQGRPIRPFITTMAGERNTEVGE